MKLAKLYLVVPCYNEQEVLSETSKQLLDKLDNLIALKKIDRNSRIMFVDDGSKDETWHIIEALHNQNNIILGIKLSHNQGHQNALLAGLMTTKELADIVISLDADLQDDINAIDEMVDKYYEGFEIVYGVRNSRKADTFFKRFTAEGFYKIINLMGAEIVYNHADYRLMSKKALDALGEFEEVNLFLRGLIPMLGFKSCEVYYERKERFAGESKYPFKKMISFAFQGITSLSIKPIKLIINLGILLFVASIIMLIYCVVRHYEGNTVSGWTSLCVSIWALGGIQLLSIGIIGEYIGKVYLETKRRPRYIIEKFISDEK